MTVIARLRKWGRYRKLTAVERYYFQLKDNNVYPFVDLGDGFYYILITSDRLPFGLSLIAIAIAAYTLSVIFIGPFSFSFILFVMFIFYGFFCVYGNTSPKELIINRYCGYVLRIKGNEKAIVEEPINNCYIKLQRKFDTNLESHFYLILGGYK